MYCLYLFVYILSKGEGEVRYWPGFGVWWGGGGRTRISVRMLGRFQREVSLPLPPLSPLLAPPLAAMNARGVMDEGWVVVTMSVRSSAAAAATLLFLLLLLLLEGHARRCHCCCCCWGWGWERVMSPKRW